MPELRSAQVWYWPLATWMISSQSPLSQAPPVPQTRPQLPQFVGSVAVEVSQPPPGVQSAKPASHTAGLHALDAHTPTATFGSLLQLFPQEPQLAASVARFVSQPSAGLPLQSDQPAEHDAMVHAPPVQAGVPLATTQT